MEQWQRQLQNSQKTLEKLVKKFNISREEINKVAEEFKVRITPYYASLIQEKDDPIYKQVIPNSRELETGQLLEDPLNEDNDSPVRNIVHRYPDRCLFLVSPVCASYCRFCTRKRKVGDANKISFSFVQEGIDYIAQHPEIRDVVVSGGEPLLLSDQKLEFILKSLRAIPHVEIIRIGTRVPCFLPHRITMKLVNMLKKYHPIFMNVHFNHPRELTPLAVSRLERLANAGIPLGCQTVLLKGVNDDVETMRLLMQTLLKARVRPYYIYQADLVFGSEHFRTRVEKGLEIIQGLRGWTSGLAVPHFVIDAPGGGGKIPLLPEYLQSMNDEQVLLKNYRGEFYNYLQPKECEADERKVALPFHENPYQK
ncbi:MAG: lysine 2,3-aminomutase [Calditrichia bacterium]